MGKRGYMAAGGAVAAGVIILGSGGHEGAPKSGEQPAQHGTEYVCDTDPSHTVTFEAGDTVSERIAAPLAHELGVTTKKALELVQKSNPGVNLSRVAVSQIFNVPQNCRLE